MPRRRKLCSTWRMMYRRDSPAAGSNRRSPDLVAITTSSLRHLETSLVAYVGVPDEPRTDRQPWSHGCRLTSRPQLDDIKRHARRASHPRRRSSAPRSSRGNQQPFSLDSPQYGTHLLKRLLPDRLLTHHPPPLGLVYTASKLKSCDDSDRRQLHPTYPLEPQSFQVQHT